MQFTVRLYKHAFIIHVVSFYRYKLISQWHDFYVRHAVVPLEEGLPQSDGHFQAVDKTKVKKVDWEKKYQFSLDEVLTALFMAFVAFRGYYASFYPSYAANPLLPILFGSFFQMMNAHPFHVEFLFFLWSTNYVANVLVAAIFKVKNFCWIELIRFFEGKVSAKKIGLTDAEAKELKCRADRILRIVHLSATSVATNAMVLFVWFCFIKYYPHFDYLFFNLIWFLLYVHYTSQMSLMIYMNAAYLYLICTMIRMKFARLEKYLNEYRKIDLQLLCYRRATQGSIGSIANSSSNKLNRRAYRSPTVDMAVSYNYLNKLARECDQYNHFWKHLFSIAVAWRLWIINFILYIVLFYPIGAHFLSIYRLITVVEIFYFFSLVFQAALIPIDAKRIGKQLRRFVDHHTIRLMPVRLKVMKQFEFLERPASMGLCLSNGTVVEPLTIIYIIREFSTWFFLLAALSFQYNLD